jgi:hypothetical protein
MNRKESGKKRYWPHRGTSTEIRLERPGKITKTSGKVVETSVSYLGGPFFESVPGDFYPFRLGLYWDAKR